MGRFYFVVLDLLHFYVQYTITVFLLGVLHSEHSRLAFDCVVIACSLESIRPDLAQCCKAPNGEDKGCFITRVGHPFFSKDRSDLCVLFHSL